MAAVLSRAAILAVALSLGACNTGEVTTRGYILDEQALGEIKPGTDVQKVLQVMGTPSTVSTVGNKSFYYISQTGRQRFRFMNEQVTDQRVVAVYFDRNFRVERVANYGLQDGVVFDFISRTTPTGGAEQSFVGNLFRGLGSFNPLGV